MIVSLDDQLEWQESSKSHSPRTPTAPEALQNLRKNSPAPTPSRGVLSLKSPESLDDLSAASTLEALDRVCNHRSLKSSRMVGEYLSFPDGSFLPLHILLPLQVRTIIRSDNGEVCSTERNAPLTIGGAWLSVMAEYTYESQLASLLRSRKGIEEITLEDRQILNRFVKGNLSLNGIKSSRLWAGDASGRLCDSGNAELNIDTDDPIGLLLRRRAQLSLLEERKAILHDQQNRLRRLLARELQRQHSTKPTAVSANIPSTVMVHSASSHVSNAVSNILKRFGTNQLNSKRLDEAGNNDMDEVPAVECDNFPVRETGTCALLSKLRCLQVEWYRICHKLKCSDEEEKVIQRKIKRIRYVSFILGGIYLR